MMGDRWGLEMGWGMGGFGGIGLLVVVLVVLGIAVVAFRRRES
jgi:ABC-type transport system involved in multi-copper enzyme maturation permease subunit